MDVKLLKHLLGPRVTEADWEVVQTVELIQSRVRSIADRRLKLIAAYDDALNALDKELRLLQSTCSHPVTKRNGEFYGSECLICGAEV